LLFLYSQTLDNVEEVENITSQIEQCLDHIRQGDLGDDVKLTQFSEHFQAYYGTLSTVADLSSFPSQGCRAGLATWKSLLNRCQSRDELLNVVDDPESLLEHLKSFSELCNLKGEAQLQLSISELSISLSKLWEGSGADRLVAHQSLLATQYIGIGLYAQAATTLKETEDIVAQNPEVSARVLAEFHLSQAEYFAGIGRSDEA
jgi:separase